MHHIILGAGWRLIDGSSWNIRGWNVLLLPLLTYNCYHLGLVGIWVGLFTAINILMGQTKWEDFSWMPLRYSGIAAIAVFPLGSMSWWYILACAIVGLLYPLLMKFGTKLPTWKLFDGPEAYARTIAGGVIIGLLTYL